MSMRLIGATTSPYVRKVRAVMAEKKLDYQFVAENVWADVNTLLSCWAPSDGAESETGTLPAPT